MGKAAIQSALRAAGVGGDLSVALAVDLNEGGDVPGDDGAYVNAQRRIDAAARTGAGIEVSWDLPFLVADADVCGGFGDLCGRRVA